MKSIEEMNYTELVREQKRINKVLCEIDSVNLRKDLKKYLSKIEKELKEYTRFKGV